MEQQLVERLQQLEPLIGEYHQLRRLAQRLGVSYTPPEQDPAATGTPAGSPTAAKKSTPAARSARKPPGARRTSAKRPAKRASRTPAAAASSPRSAGAPTAVNATAATAETAKQRAPRSRRRKPAGTRGRRTQDVLRAVGEQPGISVRELGELLGVDATGLYRVANKLTADRRLRKDGTRLYVVEPDAAAQPNPVAESAAGEVANAGAQPTSPNGSDDGGDASPDAEPTSSS